MFILDKSAVLYTYVVMYKVCITHLTAERLGSDRKLTLIDSADCNV
jgi:hypothetical protein